MGTLSAWLMAMRLRTLPLACSSILLGSGLAANRGEFDTRIMVLALLTATLLQILSNLANDYGDWVSGADNGERIGPPRALASGVISRRQMSHAMALTGLASAVAGLLLLFASFGTDWMAILAFTALGATAILAAITYTVGIGHTPYGYRGFGDISVFLFFGLLGVLGSYYLFTHTLTWELLLPAAACGLLATAVLNINNVRDIESDAQSDKITLAVRLGRRGAVIYHWALLTMGLLLSLIFLYLDEAGKWAGLLMLAILPLGHAALTLGKSRDGQVLTGALKETVLSVFVYHLLLSLGLALS
ncbi:MULTISPECIES: 1,4-dihydroxy-2-naphthoate octaprenyltransferase [Halomonadaceae]|uniref:1,4-dihydroxy-2-naphthoate octaprenyltransferase n=1 Tax=Halomonadaceae TaxID=28256 RepID=UPI00159B1727|nr:MULTISPECIES: 1,4-dihydroxy-2-naphthoate octaprenyltransferase [Halomonas]QJQ96362.1 1,4-dihydroxy-2-naphthoate octaprenyltransferase [Halomonas sp. PA5]